MIMGLFSRKKERDVEERGDHELMKIFRESSAATKAIIKREREIEGLRGRLKRLSREKFEKKEFIRARTMPGADKHITEKEIENIKEQIHVIEEKVINDLLEEIRLLNLLIVDSVKAKKILEKDEKLADEERKVIIRALKGR